MRIEKQVRLLDFTPTVLDMLGIGPMAGSEGRSLAPLWRKGEDALPDLVAVADVYDALNSDRAYRKKMDKKEVLRIIRDGAGSQFDPTVVDAFMRYYKRAEPVV